MKDLRYIKLFEAFESSKLNKTLGFLNKDGKSSFLSKLKQICKTIDLPESKLSDSLFEYLPYAKAIKFNGDAVTPMDCPAEGCDNGKVTIKWGRGTRAMDCNTCKGKGKVARKANLSVIKFWFDKDGKFLSVTGVDGNYRPGNILVDGQTRAFPTNLEDYNIGERVAKTRMNDLLNTGDIVKLTLIDRSWRSAGDKPNVVAFVLKNGGRLWAIQDTHSYSHDYIYSNDYNKIGTKAWQMTSGSIRDIFRLNLKAGDSPVEDPMGYNTQMDDNLRVKSLGIRDSIKDANFAIVLDLNKMGSLDFTKKTDIINNRKESKKDALALMTDEEIKSVNLKKYFDELVKRTKLVGSIEDIVVFSKLMARLLGGKYSVYNLSYNSSDYLSNTLPSRIASSIFQIMKTIKKKEKEGELDEYLLSAEFKELVDSANQNYEQGLDDMMNKNKIYSEYLTKLKTTIKSKNTGDDDEDKQMKVIELLDTLSAQINKLILSMPCECLEDVEIVLQEVANIRRMMQSDRAGLNSLNNFFQSMTPNSWRAGDVYNSLVYNARYGNAINGLNHLISVMKRKQSIYKK